MSSDTKRLLLEFDRQMRQINRETLNPMIEELSVSDLAPVVRMVAAARGNYINELIELAKSTDGQVPEDQQIKSLHLSRQRYEALVNASQALETAIKRGYLDVKHG